MTISGGVSNVGNPFGVMMNELITVIVPVYKVEPYICRCIDSILLQTYKNLEIILIDDGSPDRCGQICDEYANIDKRIKVIHKQNGGLSDARNTGLEISTGNYISFVDSDDWIHEKYIEKLYKILRETNSDISVCNFIETSKENVELDIAKEDIYEFSNIEALEQITDKLGTQMVVAWGKLYKKDLFENIRFPYGRIHEDDFTTYKLIYKTKKIALTKAQLIYYWKREDSITGSGYNIKHQLDKLDALEEMTVFFRGIGLKELSFKTYKSVFVMYMTIALHTNEFKDEINEKEFKARFKELRNNLRNSKQKSGFKIFYELYFVAPNTMGLIYKTYRSFRNSNRI